EKSHGCNFNIGIFMQSVTPATPPRRFRARGFFYQVHRRQMRACVLAEKRDVVRIDPKLLRVTANEIGRGAQIVERVFIVLNPAQPVIDRKPVVSGARQHLHKLSDEGNATAAAPAAAMNNDYGAGGAPGAR